MNGKSKTRTNKYSKSKSKRTTKKTTSKVPQAVKLYVKKETAKNIENKYTGSVGGTGSVLTVTYDSGSPPVGSTLDYFLFNAQQSGLFSMIQGVQQNQRLGNTIKLKRWVIKGSVYYDPNYTVDNNDGGFTQAQGYVDVYFGRPKNMVNQIQPQLTGLYQDGSSALTPSCQLTERLYSINQDQYKVLWHKRYKIGSAGSGPGGTNSSPIVNNDYKLNHEFGFDVCKLCCKNKILRYDDNTTNPEDALVSSLYVWATFTMPNQNLDLNAGGAGAVKYSPVKMAVQSYAEYEDA